MRLPDLLYVGTDKAASTWLHRVLEADKQYFVPTSKDIYFFDSEYQRGIGWYAKFFERAAPTQCAVDISHDYMFVPEAIERIATHIPDVRVLVHLREPGSRAESVLRNYAKHGYRVDDTPDMLDRYPDILEHGRYAGPVGQLLTTFGDRVFVAEYGAIAAGPEEYLSAFSAELGLPSPRSGPHALHRRVLRPSAPRFSARLNYHLRQTGVALRARGLGALVGSVKRNPVVENLLYRPTVSMSFPTVRKLVRDALSEDVRETANLLPHLDLSAVWSYTSEGEEQ